MFNGLFLGTTLLQMALLNRYCATLYGQPRIQGRYAHAAYLVSGIMIYVSSISFLPNILTGLLSVSSSLLIMLLYSGRRRSRLLFSLLYLVLGFIAESVSFYIISIFSLSPIVKKDLYTGEIRLFILLSSILIMLFFILVIRSIIKEREERLPNFYYVLMASILSTSLFIMNTLFLGSYKGWMYLLSIMGILLIDLLVIYLYDKITGKSRLAEENLKLQQQMDEQERSYERTLYSFNEIKRMIHDNNKHLVYIHACIQKEDLEEAAHYIEQTLHRLQSSYVAVSSGNLVIDALVNNAIAMAQEKKIALKYEIGALESFTSMERYELCIVLGNLLDNAIEAAEQIPESKERFIEVCIFNDRGSLGIHIINSRLQINEYRGLRPQKRPDLHGLGLSNVGRIVNKYGGHLSGEAKGDIYEAMVLIPL